MICQIAKLCAQIVMRKRLGRNCKFLKLSYIKYVLLIERRSFDELDVIFEKIIPNMQRRLELYKKIDPLFELKGELHNYFKEKFENS